MEGRPFGPSKIKVPPARDGISIWQFRFSEPLGQMCGEVASRGEIAAFPPEIPSDPLGKTKSACHGLLRMIQPIE
jgi:hypothetical protein